MEREKGQAVYGRVSSVFFDSEKNDIFVNVITGPNREPRKMMFSSPKPGIWYVPREGDMVEVHNIGGTRTARYPANPPQDFELPQDLSEGDVCFRLNEETELHFSQQEDGTVNVDLSADGDINITTTGNAVVDADTVTVTAATEAVVDAPTVKLGGDTGTKLVARKGDTVQVSDPVSGTLTGEITSGSSVTESQ